MNTVYILNLLCYLAAAAFLYAQSLSAVESAPDAKIAMVEEQEIKAAYLYKLTQYITWPEDAFKNDPSDFKICGLGEGPFNAVELNIAGLETLDKRKIIFEKIKGLEHIESCHIILFRESLPTQRAQVFSKLEKRPVLSVGEEENFIAEGGMLQFYREGPHVRFAIEPNKIQNAGLKVSAHLLRVAKIIQQGEK